MSLQTDYERSEAGRVLSLHKAAIEQHVAQIKLRIADIKEIRAKFTDESDQAEIDTVLSGAASLISSVSV